MFRKFLTLALLVFLPSCMCFHKCYQEKHYLGYIAGQPVNIHISDISQGKCFPKRVQIFPAIYESKEKSFDQSVSEKLFLYEPLPFEGDRP